MKKIGLGILLGISSFGWAQKADIQIKIKDIKTEKGKLVIGLYDNEKDFPKGKAYQKVEVTPQKSTLIYTFKGVEKGKYAIAVLHDENNNGKMDIGMFGPKEPYGFSNNARGVLSAPSFEKASFIVNGKDKSIVLNLN
ncbi:DUF2141 domain-containing protein [Weeksellaceae bacterium TAE3-ERU29]|nr:DUF2141 domain-containing protein [Weeksellaceae bacterium TAE3-ERU29]